MNENAKIYVAGHRGLVGSVLMRQLEAQGYSKLLARTHAELDLTNQAVVAAFFAAEMPDYVFLVAAYEGKIIFDAAKPDGTMRKLMDSGRLNSLGWQPTVDLKNGLQRAYADFKLHEGLL